MDIKDWVVLALAGALTIYAIATFLRDRLTFSLTNGPLLIIATFTALNWAAVALHFFSRPPQSIGRLVNYGTATPNAFQGIVTINRWSDLKDYRAMLITRTIHGDKDRMTDDWIAKSAAYAIDQPVIRMIVFTNGQMKFFGNQNSVIEFNFVLLPSQISPDQVRSLADVESLGGVIVSSATQSIPAGPGETAPSAPK